MNNLRSSLDGHVFFPIKHKSTMGGCVRKLTQKSEELNKRRINSAVMLKTTIGNSSSTVSV